jgi:hypothetical protein
MRILIFCLSLLLTASIYGQSRTSSLFDVDANHRKSGFLIGLGATKLFAQNEFEQTFLAIPEVLDAGDYIGTFDPKGKMGFHLELGMFWITERSFFDYVDLNLAYSQQRGTENMEALRQANAPDTLPAIWQSEGDFGQDIVTLNFNFNKAIPISGYWYGLGAIGADIGYRIIDDYTYLNGHPSLNATSTDDKFDMHLHFKLGVGYKTSKSSWLSLTAETPIETLIPFDGLTSRKTVFNSLYRPVNFTLRYQWLRKRPARECPTGPKPNTGKKKRRKSRGGMRDGQI